jgi:3,4-dihydroxy 2-butanone 4-phosphate synthase / GTP cyclohydrolase II
VGDVGALGPAGPLPIDEPVLVRMHRRHLLGDVFGDLDSSPGGPTGDTLRAAMAMIQREQRGAVVYLRTSGPGGSELGDLEGRLQTIRGHAHDADDPSPMTQRDFGIGGQILRALGISRLRLISNSRRALPGLEAFGLHIDEHVPVQPPT